MNGTYSQEQQIHCISSLSNASYGISFPSLSDLQTYTTKVVSSVLSNSTIQGYIGNDWTTVWGPVVYSNNPTSNAVVADNTMLLVYSPSQNLYVIGIAGTNAESFFDWKTEDFDASSRVLWTTVMGSSFKMPDNTYKNAAITGGTNTGLTNLLNMTDSSRNNISLLSALQTALSNGSSGATVAVAGHSLGGALSPVMGLYLHDSQQFSQWNSSGNAGTIAIHATAGPTPGEQHFASYVPYVTGLKTSGQASLTYESLYNTLDVVPHAWQSSTLGALPTLYESNITQPKDSSPAETIVGALAVGAVLNGIDRTNIVTELSSHLTQVQPWTSITGTFDTDTDSGISSKLKYISAVLPTSLTAYNYQIYFTNFARYAAQAVFQHTTAYSTLLSISDFASEYNTIKQQNAPGNQSEAQIRTKVVSRILGVDLSQTDFSVYPSIKTGQPASTTTA